MRNSLNDTTQTRKHSTAIITIQKSIIQRFAFKFNHIKLLHYMHKYIFQYKAYFDIRIRILTISNKIAISVACICNDSLQIFILN